MNTKEKSKLTHITGSELTIVRSFPVLFIIYFPTATVSYFTLGDCVQESMLNSLTEGTLKDVAQALILIHLIAATPICLNPPNQWLESLFNIPTGEPASLLFIFRLCNCSGFYFLTKNFCYYLNVICVERAFTK